MKLNNPNRLFCSWQFHLLVVLALAWLSQTNALSQTSSPSASLRGTAKIEGAFPVDGVMIVVIPSKAGEGPTGKPVPAWTDNDGDYRIEDIDPGSYDLKATGKTVKTKVVHGVQIKEGSSNIVNINLEKAKKPIRIRIKVKDVFGHPVIKAKIKIYAAELSSIVCVRCMLAEVTSDERGEIDVDGLASQESYQMALAIEGNPSFSGKVSAGASVAGAINMGTTLATAETITIGEGPEAQVELEVGGGSRPVLKATVLPMPALPLTRQAPRDELASSGGATNSDRVNNPSGQIKPPTGVAQSGNVRTVSDGQKMDVEGVVVRRDADTFTVRDMNGVDTVVRLTDSTSVKSRGGFLRSGTNYGTTSILRGLNVEVEGRADSSGQLVASKVRFYGSDLRVARTVESRVDPVENRVGNAEGRIEQVEQNSQRLSGQIDELAAISNAAKGGAKAAQETADAAIAGVGTTNERISALDDYVPQESIDINFRSGSAVLSRDAQAQLDEIATKALNAKGYVIEVSGYADATGSVEKNRILSTRRADAVVRYLAENHRIPLRRIVTPFGYGESQSIADNRTREGRAQNRRVEVKILVNRGLQQPGPTMKPTEP